MSDVDLVDKKVRQRKGRSLDAADIPLIRGLMALNPPIPVPEIAAKFGVTKATIYRIRNGKIWTNHTEVAK
tara:strand:- start:5927 stop:6139 length:213 start_codon:yes stop_codon:yes gene_type:complete